MYANKHKWFFIQLWDVGREMRKPQRTQGAQKEKEKKTEGIFGQA